MFIVKRTEKNGGKQNNKEHKMELRCNHSH